LPSSHLTALFLDLFSRLPQASGAHPRIGAQLYQLMSQAGFVALNARIEYGVDGGPESPYYEWYAESLRTILPRAVSLGLVTAGDIDIDTFERRLREEVVSQHAGMAGPVMFGIIGRKPSPPSLARERAIDSVGHRAHLLPQFALAGVSVPRGNVLGSLGGGLALTAACFMGGPISGRRRSVRADQ
jgi:hypothetical protein